MTDERDSSCSKPRHCRKAGFPQLPELRTSVREHVFPRAKASGLGLRAGKDPKKQSCLFDNTGGQAHPNQLSATAGLVRPQATDLKRVRMRHPEKSSNFTKVYVSVALNPLHPKVCATRIQAIDSVLPTPTAVASRSSGATSQSDVYLAASWAAVAL